QLAEELKAPLENVAEMIEVAVEAGRLVRISKEVLLDTQVFEQAQALVTMKLNEANELSVSQIRELLGTTRKIAVPLCEYFDAIGLTRRDGDVRRLANHLRSSETAFEKASN
ncbi:MAG: SelB C-terminal domain-containing protein, partial [Lacipirellulaceae bacterium]